MMGVIMKLFVGGCGLWDVGGGWFLHMAKLFAPGNTPWVKLEAQGEILMGGVMKAWSKLLTSKFLCNGSTSMLFTESTH